MKERDKLFLGHVLSAIDSIASFTVEGQGAFMADRKTAKCGDPAARNRRRGGQEPQY